MAAAGAAATTQHKITIGHGMSFTTNTINWFGLAEANKLVNSLI
jgi:hypothetical protein